MPNKDETIEIASLPLAQHTGKLLLDGPFHLSGRSPSPDRAMSLIRLHGSHHLKQVGPRLGGDQRQPDDKGHPANVQGLLRTRGVDVDRCLSNDSKHSNPLQQLYT